jgi:uncharacterized membrane protein
MLLYLLLKKARLSAARTFFVLAFGIVLGVLLAFQLIEIFKGWDDVWHSGAFLLFPVVAVVSGWISLYTAREDIKLEFLLIDSLAEEHKEA